MQKNATGGVGKVVLYALDKDCDAFKLQLNNVLFALWKSQSFVGPRMRAEGHDYDDRRKFFVSIAVMVSVFNSAPPFPPLVLPLPSRWWSRKWSLKRRARVSRALFNWPLIVNGLLCLLLQLMWCDTGGEYTSTADG